MNLDEVIFIRANFDEYPKNYLDYTDVEMIPDEREPTNLKAGNDLTYILGMKSFSEGVLHSGILHSGILHSGEKAAKLALEKLKKFR
jgi:hypothetical protein